MRYSIVILALLTLFIGCSTKNLSPSSVSDYFWSAQKNRDYDDVKKFVRKTDKEDVKLQSSIKIKRYEIEKAKITQSGTMALVPTTIYIQGFFKNDPRSEVEIDFDTYLNKTEDGWKVNMKETRKILYIAVAKQFGSTFSNGLVKKIQEGFSDLDEFHQIFRDVLKSMADSIKGLKR